MVTEYGINLRDLCFLSCCQHCKGSSTFEEWHSRLYLYFWDEMLDMLLRTQQELEAAETKRRETLPITLLTAAIPCPRQTPSCHQVQSTVAARIQDPEPFTDASLDNPWHSALCQLCLPYQPCQQCLCTPVAVTCCHLPQSFPLPGLVILD